MRAVDGNGKSRSTGQCAGYQPYHAWRVDVERIDAFCSVENPASKKVMEKSGMHYEGLLRHYYKTRDGFHDCTLYGIIRNDWEKMP